MHARLRAARDHVVHRRRLDARRLRHPGPRATGLDVGHRPLGLREFRLLDAHSRTEHERVAFDIPDGAKRIRPVGPAFHVGVGSPHHIGRRIDRLIVFELHVPNGTSTAVVGSRGD